MSGSLMSWSQAKYRITLTPQTIDGHNTCIWKVERMVRFVPGFWSVENVAHGLAATEIAAENVARGAVETDKAKLVDRRISKRRERIIELPS